jgi:iron(III) transport system ATP-binding protein
VLSVHDLSKRYEHSTRKERAETAPAVKDVTFDVAAGEFFTLLGPSGCGKTTTLRCVAGLEDPTTGSIAIGTRTVFSSADRVNIRPNRRGLGMVFQSYAIWPHMSVFDNAAFPLRVTPRRERLPKAQLRARVMDVLETMQLDHLADRPAPALSGGQQQRLALARALVTNPSVLLLDEPLSNLDAKLRGLLRLELTRVHRTFGVTVLYVTHDQGEALGMSDRIAIMRDGSIEQIATPHEIYRTPASGYVADFIGESNLVAGTIRKVTGSAGKTTCEVDTEFGRLAGVASIRLVTVGEKVLLSVRPHDIGIVGDARAAGTAPGTVESAMFAGDRVDYVVRTKDRDLRVSALPSPVFEPGQKVGLRFSSESMHLLAGSPG